ncbi:insulinase family protein (plasmid) [Streptomyces sp. NBC_01558]|uniref:M16 family metallopeptidase n=1 Tax=Streptomyces sp. NBC_01558 TaxID=2975878 RepID=UPI002DDA537C|nr:pitrilysin family protein [Streptomyces sp. NBC_01558]WSD82737.1 insulinase family protein [Streptomyces sp. NBC_01558]
MPDAIHHTTLDNGLRVVAQRVEGTSGVGISVNYRVGFRTEKPTRSGFAHLFEHMMFQGSLNTAPGEHFAAIQACGGVVNANTFPDSTDYYQVVPGEALNKVLELEADRMGFLTVTPDRFTTQRNVVKEEIRLQVTGRPYGGFPWTVLPAVMFDRWENAHNGYGELADLDAANADDCTDFFHTHYAPGNAVLALCGDLDPEQAVSTARAAFAHVPARPAPTLPDLDEPPAEHERRGTCHDPAAPRPALAIGSRLPDARHDLRGYAAHVVLAHLLTTGGHARLRTALAPSGAKVDSATGYFGPLAVTHPDTFVIVSHHPAGQAQKIEQIIDGQLADVAGGASNGTETRRAVACARTGLYRDFDSLAYRVRLLSRGTLLFDQPDIGEQLAHHVTDVNDDDITAAAANVASPTGRALLNLLPQETAR